jgi:hypothetical protein
MEQIDLQHFDRRFENKPEPVGTGTGYSSMDQKRVEWMKENIGTYQVPSLGYPEIAGLRTHSGKLPVTRQWYRRIASYEMNGLLNMWTPTMNTKMVYWLFYPCVMWGKVFDFFLHNIPLF